MEATAQMPDTRRTNWAMIARVGLVVALVLALVGYAAKVTYESVIQGGVVSAGDHYDVDLKALSNFEMDQVNGTLADIPERFRKLDGKKVLLQGEIAPTGYEAGPNITKFSLCYSVAKCCFGGPPKPQHFVACSSPAGKQITSNSVKVYGTLHINVINTGGAVSSVFQLDVERVEPVS
jgi:hypothetical protein